MSDFSRFLGPFSTGVQIDIFPTCNSKKKYLFLTRIFIQSTSSEKVVFFAGRSVQGFQKPYYFPMNRHTHTVLGGGRDCVYRDVLVFF